MGRGPVSAVAMQGHVSPPTRSAVVPAGYQESAESTANSPFPTGSGNQKLAPGLFHRRFVPRHPGPPAPVRGHVLSVRVVGQPAANVPFLLQMAIGGSAAYTRCFEATNANPLQAMCQVLQQVETQRQLTTTN